MSLGKTEIISRQDGRKVESWICGIRYAPIHAILTREARAGLVEVYVIITECVAKQKDKRVRALKPGCPKGLAGEDPVALTRKLWAYKT